MGNFDINMVTKASTDHTDTFACDACGFKYASEDLAQKCEHACSTQGICRSDVAKQALAEIEPADTKSHEDAP